MGFITTLKLKDFWESIRFITNGEISTNKGFSLEGAQMSYCICTACFVSPFAVDSEERDFQ